LDKRRAVTRIIRKVKPQIVASCDPLNYYIGDRYLNHPDHRAAGQVVVDSVFPAAINNAFFPELIKEGLPAVKVLELWLSLPQKPNVSLDVEEYWEKRKLALLEHKSQIGEPADFLKHIEARKKESNNESAHYQEYFRRILF